MRERAEHFALLQEWYGKNYAAIEISAHTAEPISVTELVEKECREAMDRETAVWLDISSHWPRIVGTQLASLAAPAGLRDGELSLEVRHPLIIRELAGSSDLILEHIRSSVTGGDICKKIKLVPSGRGRR